MKKFLSLFLGCLIVLLAFAAPGQSAKAAENVTLSTGTESAEPSGDCECHNVTLILGSERNKIVAELISSEEFNYQKQQAKELGYTWSGAGAIQVIKYNKTGDVLVGAPFVTKDGNQVVFAFVNGSFAAITQL